MRNRSKSNMLLNWFRGMVIVRLLRLMSRSDSHLSKTPRHNLPFKSILASLPVTIQSERLFRTRIIGIVRVMEKAEIWRHRQNRLDLTSKMWADNKKCLIYSSKTRAMPFHRRKEVMLVNLCLKWSMVGESRKLRKLVAPRSRKRILRWSRPNRKYCVEWSCNRLNKESKSNRTWKSFCRSNWRWRTRWV